MESFDRMTPIKSLGKTLLSCVRKPISQRNTRMIISRNPPPYNVHIGSGNTLLKGWINTDIGWRAAYWLDATATWPFPNNSVKYVYADNVIEHLPIGSARMFFLNAYRSMQDGGVIRLATPDIGALVELYIERAASATWHLQRAAESGYQANHFVDLLRIAIQECGHHTGQPWDFDALSRELASAGFTNIHRETHRSSKHQALSELEMRPEENCPKSIDLVVEATKRHS